MDHLQNNQEYVVIKAGTETLIKDGVPNIKVMKNIAKCIARLREKGIGVILVSSGAVGHAMSTLSESIAALMEGKSRHSLHWVSLT